MTHEYDVGISFLGRDHATAVALRERLSASMKVFEFTTRQEELAGTDGLTTLRLVFGGSARLVVVLFRAGWGDSPWTRVEHVAIQDRFLKEGPSFLLFVMLDSTAPPPWVPEARIRLDFATYGLDQAAGAIRLRVQDLGGATTKEAVADRARRAAESQRFAAETSALRGNAKGVEGVRSEAGNLFQDLTGHLQEVSEAAPGLQCEWKQADTAWGVRSPRASVYVQLHIEYLNSLDHAWLSVRHMSGGIILPGENKFYLSEPKIINDTRYEPDRVLGIGWGWRFDGKVMSSHELAELTVRKLLDRIADPEGAA